MRSLYISQNGMLENLGQSQVLPYLRGLARRGVAIELISFELPDVDPDAVRTLGAALAGQGIRWRPLQRARDARLRRKVFESARGTFAALRLALASRPDIIHGRSHFPTAIADAIATTVPRARLLFDCRGMLGDEYVDAGYWTRDKLEYRLVKRFEARAFRRADGVVVLTQALRRWLLERSMVPDASRIEAIPCCVDLERFQFDEVARTRLRAELGLEDRLVLSYSGSLGSWYREPDLARFAGIVRRRADKKVAFLILTPSPPEPLVDLVRREGFASDEIIVRRVRPAEMNTYLSAADIGLSFITSCFSKMGSSPTKVAEYLACGLVTVLNGDIGDQAELAADREACVVLDGFDDAALVAAADRAMALAARPLVERVTTSRAVAEVRFGIETVGVARYERLYRRIAGG